MTIIVISGTSSSSNKGWCFLFKDHQVSLHPGAACSYVTYSKHRLLKFGTFTQYVWLLFTAGEAGSKVALLGESK